MLSVNSVLVPAEANVEVTFTSNMLVVYIDRHSKQVCLLPLDKKRQRKPKPYPFKVIAGLVEAKAVIKAQLDIPTYQLLDDSSFTTSRIEKRNERYQIISPIISEIHRYMFPRYGRSIVAQVAQKTGMQPTAIVRLMNMWFYGGQTINALLGDYSQVGITSPGENTRKVGAKRKNSPFVGRAITEQDIAKIRRFLNKYVLTRKIEEQMTLQGAYDEMLDLEYSTLLVAANGRKTVASWSDDDIPSYNQFYYHARKYFDEQKKYPRQFQVTAAVHQKDHAGRTATIERINRPGELYQIDETPFDVVLVANRFSITGLCVGSPTLYLVYDVHSNLVVGIHLTLNPPSWEGMRQALLNAFLPKVEFCQRYGININEEDWPYGVPDELLGDNAELRAEMSELLEQQFNCSVRFTRSRRGDDKGLVEGGFPAFHRALKGRLPGVQHSKQNDKGLTESRFRAILTIDDLYKILINLALFRNKNIELSYDKLDRDMRKDDVIPKPLALWRWGCRERGGPKTYSRDYIESRLKSKGTATIKKEGVKFKDLWYNCDWTLQNGLQDRKPAGNKSPKVVCLYDKNTTDTITLVIDKKFYTAYLQERSRRYIGVTFDEVELEIESETFAKNQRAQELRSAKATLNTEIRDIVTSAKEKIPKIVKAERRGQNIRKNRKTEASIETAILRKAANKSNKKPGPTEKTTAKNRSAAHDVAPNKSQKNISQALDSLISGDDDD